MRVHFCAAFVGALCFVAAVGATPRIQCLAAEKASEIGLGGIFSKYGPACAASTPTAVSHPSSSASSFASASSRSSGGGSSRSSSFASTRTTGSSAFQIGSSVATDSFLTTYEPDEGPFKILVDIEVQYVTFKAWHLMRNFGNVLLYGLEDYASDFQSLDAKRKEWRVLLNSGESIQFKVIATNNEEYHHVVEIDNHTPNVFPGVTIAGSRIFFRFSEASATTTLIQFGWGGKFIGPVDVAITVVSAWAQEMLDSLEKRFGGLCDEVTNIRTIEGDCNNLGDPRRAAAGHPLLRMGGVDPSFPNGDPTEPSGALHISPRAISNELCATSPGIEILEENAEKLKSSCVNSREMNGDTWIVCPYRFADRISASGSEFKMEWAGLSARKDGYMNLHFSGAECDLKFALACHGRAMVELDDEPCGSEANTFFHPIACTIRPGADEVLSNSKEFTDLFWTFGQFVDHDIGLTPVTQLAAKKQPGFSKISRSTEDPFPIHVPSHDFFFKQRELEFERTTLIKDTKVGIHENQHSSYADLGQVYGADYLRALTLRSFKDGKLKVHGDDLPPFNKLNGVGALRAKIDNAPDADDRFFAVGDVRGNEQTLLLSMHIIWIREHNRVCDELSATFPDWSDEELYQTARAICIAEYQSILYDEWLPLVLGSDSPSSGAYAYDASIDASITAIFSTIAFRFGHTIVGSFLLKLGAGPRSSAYTELVPLRRVFFKPEIVQREGIDDYLRGGAWHLCKEFDAKIVDELRNFLFTEDESKGHMDLLALNIQRGRDMGIPSFNKVRELFGLRPYESFYEFVGDLHQAAASERVYNDNIDLCDAFYGGIAEEPLPDAMVGETFHAIIKSQFTKIRDGDRFFFKGIRFDGALLAGYPRLDEIMAGGIKLVDILVRNTHIKSEEFGHRSSKTIFKL